MKENENILMLALLIVVALILGIVPWIIMAVYVSKFCLLGSLPIGILGYLLIKGASIQNNYEDQEKI